MVLFLIIFILLIGLLIYRSNYVRYKRILDQEINKKNGISIKHGKFIENFLPWIKQFFPRDPKKFKFIGDPVDGILFDDDKIIFYEFKTGTSQLTKRQKKIKKLIKRKKVGWKEIRTDK